MPLAARIPTGSRLEDAIRVFLAFESKFMQGIDGLDGQLATGALRVEGSEGPTSLPPELSDIAAAWQGPRDPDDQVILGGEFARRIEERDYSELPQDKYLLSTVDVIATGRPSTVTSRSEEYNLVLACESTAGFGRTPAEQAEAVDRNLAEVGRGSAWALQLLAQRGLRQLATLDARSTPVNLDGVMLEVPILGLSGRLLHGMAMFGDETRTWAEDMAHHGARHPYSFATNRTVNNFIESVTPALLSARRNPNRFKQEMIALGRRHPALFGAEQPAETIDHLIRHHVTSFLTVPERLATELHHALEVDPRMVRVEPFTFDEVQRTVGLIRFALHLPDRAMATDHPFGR